MEGKKTILAAVAGVVLVATEVALYLRFRLSRTFYLSAAAVLLVVLSAAAVALLLHSLSARGRAERMATRRALDGEELRMEYSFFRKVAGLPSKFTLEALAAATDGFQCVAGRGSSGTVFRGILDDGTAVAVKRIDGAEHADRAFKAEVSAIASVQHAHLVRLLGFCLVPRGGPRYLVYEFMEHGSLDRWIFPHHRAAAGCLPWARRYQVAVDVARALAYLHGDCRATVLHLDVKPANILLDGGFRGLLSDFGLSKLLGKEESRALTAARGTVGYVAPEWLLGAGVAESSDVYSYGVVLLEMVAGRRSLGLTYLPEIAADMARKGRVMEVVDRRLVESSPEAAVRRAVHVALWCAQENAGARPTMARVVEMLEGRGAEVEAPPPSDFAMLGLLPRGGPFGLSPPSSDGGGLQEAVSLSVLSNLDSFALSYMSGR